MCFEWYTQRFSQYPARADSRLHCAWFVCIHNLRKQLQMNQAQYDQLLARKDADWVPANAANTAQAQLSPLSSCCTKSELTF